LLEQQGKGSATYYTLHSDLLDNDLSSEFTEQFASNLESSSTDKALSIEFSSTDKDSYLNQMPEHLQQAVQTLGKRANPQEIRSVIVALCQWRDLSSRELATILSRDQGYLLNKYLNPLVNSGSLEYARSKNPTDPHQAYRATTREQA
jgi:ATP-dependent DNA helicase RecG